MEKEQKECGQSTNNFYGHITNYIVYQSEVTYEGQVNTYNENSREKEKEREYSDVEERIKSAIDILKDEREIKHLYDYTWLMQAMNDTKDLPHFDNPQSFINYMEMLGIEALPEVSTVKKAYGKVVGTFPQWTFLDADATESNRRVNVVKRFISAYRKGE